MKKISLPKATIILLTICIIGLIIGNTIPDEGNIKGLKTLILFLLPAGILAGLANYYITYLGLPVTTPDPTTQGKGSDQMAFDGEGSEEPTAQQWVVTRSEDRAFLGYIVTGICGSMLTPVLHAIVGLKGLEKGGVESVTMPMIAFGYGIVFGFAANKLLNSISDLVIAQLLAQQRMIINASTGGAEGGRPRAVVQYLNRLTEKDYINDLEFVSKLVSATTAEVIKAATMKEFIAELMKEASWRKVRVGDLTKEFRQDRVVLAGFTDGAENNFLLVVTTDSLQRRVFDWGASKVRPAARLEARERMEAAFSKKEEELLFFSHQSI